MDSLVRDVYGSLLDDPSFKAPLTVVGRAFSSHITALHHEDPHRHDARLDVIGELAPDEFHRMADEYSARWAGLNLWVARGIPTLLANGFDSGDGVVSDRELLASEYYRHFLRPAGIRFGLGILLQGRPGSALSILSVNRLESVGRFDTEDLRFVAALRPHLVNAFAICRQLEVRHDSTASLRALFDRASIGLMVLDVDGRVLEHNPEAARLLAGGGGAALSAEARLRIADETARHRYRAALLRLAASTAASPELIVLPSPSHAPVGTLVLALCAVPPTGLTRTAGRGRVLGFLREVGAHPDPAFAARVLRDVYDLTPAESAVVLSLRDHHDPAHVAVDLGLAISTVRTHLKHAFHKTGTARQSELLRLLDCLLAVRPG